MSASVSRKSPFPPRAIAPRASTPFPVSHAVWPALLYLLAFTWLALLHGDFWWADRLYAWSGHAWTLQRHWLAESVLHVGGRSLSALAWVLVLAACVLSSLRPRWREWRRPLLYLLLSVAVTTLIAGLLKSVTGMDCPWDLLRYGGERPFVGLLEARPLSLPRAACFPAGHASGGYAWIALYFFWRVTRPRWRYYGLAIGLGLGAAFGLAQQLRGAHFLSHDLTTLAIAWFVALGLYQLMRLPDAAQAGRKPAVPALRMAWDVHP